MSRDVPNPVRLADHAVRIDHERPSLRVLGGGLIRVADRLVAAADVSARVGQEREGEPVLLREGPVVLDRVEGGADQVDAQRLELGGSITEPRALQRSPLGERFGEPPEHDPPAAELLQRDRPAVVVGQREGGSRRPLGEHRPSLRQYAGAVIEVTDWARDILGRSHTAAKRFDPSAVIRLVRTPSGVEARLADGPDDGDQRVEVTDEVTVYAEPDLEGVLDIEEPHDRVVLNPPGSRPNVRE